MKNNDLTNGSIIKLLIRLAVPITITGFIEMAYTLTDMFWIGLKGAEYVSAVGAAGNFGWIALCLITIPRLGGQVKTAQNIGAKNYLAAKEFIISSFQIGALISILIAAIFFLFPKYLIGVFNLNNDFTINLAIQYMRILAFILIPQSFSIIFTGMFTAIGNTKLSLICNGLGVIANIILDPVFIYVFDLGIVGAGIATLISNCLLFSAYIYSTRYYSVFFSNTNLFNIDFQKMKEIVQIGFPPAIQGAIYSSISLGIGRIVATYGSFAVGVKMVGAQVEAIAWKTAEGLGSAVNTFTAQNFGARKLLRVKKAHQNALVILILIGSFSTFTLITFARDIISIFYVDERAIEIGISYLTIIAFSHILMCMEIVVHGALAGLGITFSTNLTSILIISLRIPLALFITKIGLGINGVWWVMSITSMMNGLGLFIIYVIKYRKHILPAVKEEMNIVC